jgi:hypothetical protein
MKHSKELIPMKPTEENVIALDEGEEIVKALIEDLERPTKHSRERIEEWLKKYPHRLLEIITDTREPMVKEVYPVYPVGVEQNKAS